MGGRRMDTHFFFLNTQPVCYIAASAEDKSSSSSVTFDLIAIPEADRKNGCVE
jgi:hypothetical protein